MEWHVAFTGCYVFSRYKVLLAHGWLCACGRFIIRTNC